MPTLFGGASPLSLSTLKAMGSLRGASLKAIGRAFASRHRRSIFGSSKPAPNVNPTSPPARERFGADDSYRPKPSFALGILPVGQEKILKQAVDEGAHSIWVSCRVETEIRKDLSLERLNARNPFMRGVIC